MTRRIGSLVTGASLALLPLVTAAQTAGGDRSLEAPADFSEGLLYTLLALGGLFLVATIGYTYRVKRNLTWRFQEPDSGHHDDHH